MESAEWKMRRICKEWSVSTCGRMPRHRETKIRCAEPYRLRSMRWCGSSFWWWWWTERPAKRQSLAMTRKFSSFTVTRGIQTSTCLGLSGDYEGLIEMPCGSRRFKSMQSTLGTKATHVLNTASTSGMRRLFAPNLRSRKSSLRQIS